MGKHGILIVDDEPYIRSTLYRLFQREGCHCLLAENAEDAFLFLKKRQVSVIFSDVVLPGESGLEFLSAVKLHYPNISRVCMSGRAGKIARVAAMKDNVVSHFLTKPWDNKGLIKILYHAISQYEQHLSSDVFFKGEGRVERQEGLEIYSPDISLVAEDSHQVIVIEG